MSVNAHRGTPRPKSCWLLGVLVALSIITAACSDEIEQADQASAVADGTVTYDDYAAAVNNAVDCIRDEGVNVVGPVPYEPDPNFLYYESSAETDAESAANDVIIDGCQRRHSSNIEGAWATANAPSQKENDKLYLDAIACVETTTGDDLSGYTADTNDLNDLIALYDRIYIDCLTKDH